MQVPSGGEGDGRGAGVSFVHGERWEGEVRGGGGVGGRSEGHATDGGEEGAPQKKLKPFHLDFFQRSQQ